jgi:threonine/homoserine/homoserine lactone efflux protein
MSDLLVLGAIAGAIAVGAASPGPSFVYVSRLSLARSRAHGLVAALGMGAGGVTFALVAMLGLGAILHYAEWAYIGLKVVGGCYLVYLGVRMWMHAGRGSSDPASTVDHGPAWRSFLPSLLTQLSNPKAIVVYGSIFAAIMPADPAWWLFVAVPLTVFAIETGWYTIVAVAMSSRRPRAVYARFAKAIDRVAGTILGGLGAVFAIDGVRSALR